MAFFDDRKNVGTLILIVALLNVVTMAMALSAYPPYNEANWWEKAIIIVGLSVCTAVYAAVGFDIYFGKCRIRVGKIFSDTTTKYGILVVALIGTSIGDAILTLSGLMVTGVDDLSDVLISLLSIIFAVLLVYGGRNVRIISWLAILILLIVSTVLSLVLVVVMVGIPNLLLYLMLLVHLFSSEVRHKVWSGEPLVSESQSE